ncbi:MAG: hypothetical protein GX615_14245 [Lentisphaerae bacterium]|nr:hypothetical protein [Lentisphaerota bacterium]
MSECIRQLCVYIVMDKNGGMFVERVQTVQEFIHDPLDNRMMTDYSGMPDVVSQIERALRLFRADDPKVKARELNRCIRHARRLVCDGAIEQMAAAEEVEWWLEIAKFAAEANKRFGKGVK